jgi:hypothetical protein
MKKALPTLFAAALIAASAASTAMAHTQNPITDWRRTLFTSYGQHTLVFEAPVGMCFLDESDYLEGSIMSQFKDVNPQSKLIGTFADCMEISKIQHDYQEQLEAHPDMEAPPSVTLKSHGSIYWLNPYNGDEIIALPRSGYLDVRAKTFKDDILKEMNDGGHGMVQAALLDPNDKYHFDDAPHRTADGMSIAYELNTEIEYEKVHDTGVIATTLIDHMPLEFSFDFSAKDNNKDNKALYAMVDTFMAQQVKLNAQMAGQ